MMRALSLLWPWSALLVRGPKRVETRGRPIGLVTGEELCVHESRGEVAPDVVRDVLRAAGLEDVERNPGCIVGIVRVAAQATSDGMTPEGWMAGATKEERDAEYKLGDFSPRRHLILTDSAARFLRPVKARGMPGLWTVPDATWDSLCAAARVPVRR